MSRPTRVKPVPEGHHTVTPYLIVKDAARLLAFAQAAFGAAVILHMKRADGSAGHTEIQIGDSRVMLADASDHAPAQPVMLHLYVEGVDDVYARAIAAGGTPIAPPTDMFYGDRSGGVADPVGNQWWIATHVEDVPQDELERRFAATQAKAR